MRQRKIRWRGITLAAVTAVLIGGMSGPLNLEAAGLDSGRRIVRTAPTVTDGETERTEVPSPGAEAEPAAKAVARVRIDGADTDYTDMKEAWAAVNGRRAQITLLDGVTTTADMSTAFELTGGNVTLNLNGYKWTYQYAADNGNPPATFDLIELRGDAALTVKGGSGSAMVYAGSSNYKGACLYATGDTTLTIEGGTYSSNVSAPVYVDGATLNIKGGVFRAAGASESAITMNNGTFRMTGGEVEVGNLTLNNTNGKQKASIGGNCKLAGIVTKGKNALTIEETLEDGYKYQNPDGEEAEPSANEDGQSGENASNVQVRENLIQSMTLSLSRNGVPADDKAAEFTYGTNDTPEKKEFTLEANAELAQTAAAAGKTVTYNWKVSYNGGSEVPLTGKGLSANRKNYTFDNTQNAGKYKYIAEAVVDGEVQEKREYEFEITPIQGAITERVSNPCKREYTYGDTINPPNQENFDLLPLVPAGRTLNWNYQWYKDQKEGVTPTSTTPTDAGTYILVVTVNEGPNYKAVSSDITVVIAQKTVRPEFNRPTKVYDGTKDVKGAEITLKSGGETVPQSRDGVQAEAVFSYDDANVGTNKTITVTEIKLTGAKAPNYKLTDETGRTTTGDITQASVILRIEVSPTTQEVNKPVTITVTALNGDGSNTPNTVLKAEDLVLKVSRGEEEAPALKSAGNGVFTAEYTTATAGDRSFSVELKDNANYNLSNAASVNSVTFTETVIQSAVALTADKTEITYGGEVTYTATVSIVDGKKGDEISGGLQFYLDGEESKNRVGTAKSIKKSGDKVSIKLNKSDLTVGDRKVTAVFSSDTAEGSKAEVTTKVEKKQLTWDASGLSASKTAGTSGETKVYGTLKVEGILDGEVKFEQPESMITSGLKSADAGSYKVSVVPDEKEEWKFDPSDPQNYALPEEDPQIRATVNALKELSGPPETKDGKSYKLVMEEGLSGVPDGLKRTAFNTPAKVEEELKRILTSSGSYSEENTAIYDVTLQVSTDEGKTWVAATADNFPAGGVVVTLPYPGGTGRYTHNFAVAHMFGESLFGHTSGTVEVPAATKTDNGLQFRVTGLSPIAVSWTEGSGGGVSGTASAAVSTAARRLLGAQTGDDSPILLYAALGAGCVLMLLILAAVFLVHRRRK